MTTKETKNPLSKTTKDTKNSKDLWYGVATMSRILKNICLFAEYRSLL